MPQLIARQQAEIDHGDAVEIVVIAGSTVRGTTYFQETKLLVSPEYARYLVEQKQAHYAAAR